MLAARGQPAGESERDGIRRVQLVFMLERTRKSHGGRRKVTGPPELTGTSFTTTTADWEKTRWFPRHLTPQVKLASRSVVRVRVRVSVLLRAA